MLTDIPVLWTHITLFNPTHDSVCARPLGRVIRGIMLSSAGRGLIISALKNRMGN